MNLMSIRIITEVIDPLVDFYEKVTGLKMIKYTPDFAELKTKNATLAIGSTKTLAFFGGKEVAEANKNRSAIIEFMVDDLERLFEEQLEFLTPFVVQKPTKMPWGNLSLLLRDPDGNLVNLFTPLSEDAIKRANNQ